MCGVRAAVVAARRQAALIKAVTPSPGRRPVRLGLTVGAHCLLSNYQITPPPAAAHYSQEKYLRACGPSRNNLSRGVGEIGAHRPAWI